MERYYCIDVSFPEVDFDTYYLATTTNSKKLHHAHLYSDEDKIEIRIFFERETYLDQKMGRWLATINISEFGTYLKVTNESSNKDMIKLDLSTSALNGWTMSDKQVENGRSYIKILLDRIKIYWKPSRQETNTGDFYLNSTGFKLIKEYYAPLFGWDGKFEISRMDSMHDFYPIENSKFRPEFEFNFHGNRDAQTETITKVPLIRFHYEDFITEERAEFYGNVVRLLLSFYSNLRINYSLYKIRLAEHTVVVKRIFPEELPLRSETFMAFHLNWDLHDFLKTNWQSYAIENYAKLSKAVELYHLSRVVEDSARFLIRYNIIEICMGGYSVKTSKFNVTSDSQQMEKQLNIALNALLETVLVDEHEDFKKKWTTVKEKLLYKPMKSPLKSFLESQKIPTDELPISVNKLKKIRDDLTHGSIDRVNPKELQRANSLLRYITGLLILNMLGVSEWEFEINLGSR